PMIGLRTLLFTIFVPGTVTVVFPLLLLRSDLELFRFAPDGLRIPGAGAILAGVTLYARCAWAFTAVGRGTPAPFDPPRRLVTSGPYAWTRNPIYVAVPLILFGEALWFGSGALLAYGVILLLGFHLRVVYYEEPKLRRSFGAAFDEYCAAVPRWIPRRRRKGEREAASRLSEDE
ncbi:MAG: methyltransferase family protein, partial [Candidatus Binatia bacterium]